MIIEIFKITAFIIIIITIVIVISYLSFVCGYNDAMKKVGNVSAPAIKNAVGVVKQDDRIIECNGMMIPMQCKECRFGRVKKDSVECFAPDYDGIPTIGLKR